MSIFGKLFGITQTQTPDAPESFGFKMGWLYVKTADSESLATALQLTKTKPANWKEGIHAVYSESRYPFRKIFVSPPMDGWSFVVGSFFVEPDGDTVPAEDVTKLAALATTLSSKFGECQAFVSQRAVDFHVWIRAKDGQVLRKFGNLGEQSLLLANEGEVTAAEKQLDWEKLNTDWFPQEDDVMTVAGGWGINPQHLEGLPISSAMGIIGEITS